MKEQSNESNQTEKVTILEQENADLKAQLESVQSQLKLSTQANNTAKGSQNDVKLQMNRAFDKYRI